MTPRRLTRRDLFTGPAIFTGPAVDQSTAADFVVRVHRRMMACRVEIVLPGEDSEHLSAASAALDEGDRLEQIMTIFQDGSELTHVNRNAHLAPVPVTEELFAVLSLAASVADASGGAFDVSSSPLSRCWGFLARAGRLPSHDEIEEARALVGMHLVELNHEDRTVYFRRERVTLNLGSIGKGFALDRMSTFLEGRGVRQALLSAGSSSMVALGGAATPWRVDLYTASTGDLLARLELTDAALGTSGAGQQFVEIDGMRYGHVIDPRTGWPASGVLSASVITTDAATADALSTAFLIGGADMARLYCAQHRNVLAVITPDDGKRRPIVFGSCEGASVELL
jgi:thiamine biosynthesis lipoprotein